MADTEPTLNAEQQLVALGIPEAEASMLSSALFMFALIDPTSIDKALDAISHAQAFGPFIDPTGFVTGRLRFERGDNNAEVLRAARKLAQVLRAQRDAAAAKGKGG